MHLNSALRVGGYTLLATTWGKDTRELWVKCKLRKKRIHAPFDPEISFVGMFTHVHKYICTRIFITSFTYNSKRMKKTYMLISEKTIVHA